MEIHPRVTQIDVSGLGGIWVYLIRGPKTAIIDTGPNKPLAPALKKPGMTPSDIDLMRGKNTAIIDAGPNQSPEKHVAPVLKYVAPVLKKLGMTLADIDLILNTHVHFDHTGGNAALKSACNAPILIHTDEAIYFEKPELLFEREVAPAVEVILGKAHIEEEKKRFMEMPGPYAAVDRRLEDNDIIELGEGCDLKVIHLPGHSPGSIGFYLEEEGIIFAGDSMQGVCEHDGGLPIIDDLAAYERSLERVQKMPLKVMVHSHPFRGLTIPRSSVMRGGEIKQFLEECWEFAQRLREAAKSVAPSFSKKPFLELYDEVVGRLPREWGLKPASQMSRQFFSAATLLKCIKQMKK